MIIIDKAEPEKNVFISCVHPFRTCCQYYPQCNLWHHWRQLLISHAVSSGVTKGFYNIFTYAVVLLKSCKHTLNVKLVELPLKVNWTIMWVVVISYLHTGSGCWGARDKCVCVCSITTQTMCTCTSSLRVCVLFEISTLHSYYSISLSLMLRVA